MNRVPSRASERERKTRGKSKTMSRSDANYGQFHANDLIQCKLSFFSLSLSVQFLFSFRPAECAWNRYYNLIFDYDWNISKLLLLFGFGKLFVDIDAQSLNARYDFNYVCCCLWIESRQWTKWLLKCEILHTFCAIDNRFLFRLKSSD